MGNGIIRRMGVMVGLLCVSVLAHGQIWMEGKMGQYPIVVKLMYSKEDKNYYGQYAYKSTLNRLGEANRDAWLYFSMPYNKGGDWIVNDNNLSTVERWRNVRLSLSGAQKSISGTMTNNKGRTYQFSAQTQSAQTASSGGWAGTYYIHGELYRCASTTMTLTLSAAGGNSYTGTITIDEEAYGSLNGKVKATANGSVLTVVLQRYTSRAGSSCNIFDQLYSEHYPLLTTPSTILKIQRKSSGYGVQIIGDLNSYIDYDISIRKK